MEYWPLFLAPLALVGGGRRLGWLCLALAKEAVVAKLPENVEEKNAGDAKHDDALEKAVHGGDGAGDDNPPDARERDEAEQDGNQEHHGKQWTSLGAFVATVLIVARCSQPNELATLPVEILRASSSDALRTTIAINAMPQGLNVASTVFESFAASVTLTSCSPSFSWTNAMV